MPAAGAVTTTDPPGGMMISPPTLRVLETVSTAVVAVSMPSRATASGVSVRVVRLPSVTGLAIAAGAGALAGTPSFPLQADSAAPTMSIDQRKCGIQGLSITETRSFGQSRDRA